MKCLHGKTQNMDESLTFVEMVTYFAVIDFNDGSKGILDVVY